MKNSDIVILFRAGAAEISAYCLTAADAYAVFKFRKALRAAFESVCYTEQQLLREVGINDMEAFARRYDALTSNRNKDWNAAAELADMDKQKNAYVGLRTQLMDDAAPELPRVELPYETWRLLQEENKTNAKLTGLAEELLEGILWTAPQK